jgi:protein-L-isoaspartate(D-aspartate) O-methyltransferase
MKTPPRRFPLSLERVGARDGGGALLRPQSPIEAAARERGRAAQPAGLGLDSDGVRARLVERLLAEGLSDERVIAALRTVPRHRFVDSALVQQAYEDTSLPIGLGQTISKPSVVARMLALMLAVQPADRRPRVLEIGTGCGYQAAVIAQFARDLISVERLKPLHDKARANLSEVGVRNVRLVYGDGRLGHAPNAPYDGIIAAAGGEDLPAPWLDQLAPGGRLVAPMSGAGGGQVLMVVDRAPDGALRRAVHEAVRFVPLKSGLA